MFDSILFFNVNPVFFYFFLVEQVQSGNTDQEFNVMAPNKKTKQAPILEMEKSKIAPEVLMPPPPPPSTPPRTSSGGPPDTPRPSKEPPLSVLTRETSMSNSDHRMFVEEPSRNKKDNTSSNDSDSDYPPNRWSQQPPPGSDHSESSLAETLSLGKRKRTFKPSRLFRELKKPRTFGDYFDNCTFHIHIGTE